MNFPIPGQRGSKVIMVASSLGYLSYYVWFTGIVQLQTVSVGFPLSGLSLNFFEMSSAAYTGPAFQIVDGSTIINIRLIALLISAALAFALGLNISLLWGIYRLRGLRTCLYLGGASGFAAIAANLASFSYLCCGWATSMLLIGSTFLAGFSIFMTIGVALLLFTNAYILRRRYESLTGASSKISS